MQYKYISLGGNHLKNKINIVLNVIILALVMLIVAYILEPLFYGEKTEGKAIESEEDVAALRNTIQIYSQSFLNENYEKIKASVPFVKRKSEDVYKTISNVYTSVLIDENIDFQIYNVKKVNKNTYIVEYFLKSGYSSQGIIKNKVIIKLNKRKGTFNIYYDKLLNS